MQLCNNCGLINQIEFKVIHGDTVDGFVALDDIRFNTEKAECPFEPAQAWPVEPSTTPVPTEPPDSKNRIKNIYFKTERVLKFKL